MQPSSPRVEAILTKLVQILSLWREVYGSKGQEYPEEFLLAAGLLADAMGVTPVAEATGIPRSRIVDAFFRVEMEASGCLELKEETEMPPEQAKKAPGRVSAGDGECEVIPFPKSHMVAKGRLQKRHCRMGENRDVGHGTRNTKTTEAVRPPKEKS